MSSSNISRWSFSMFHLETPSGIFVQKVLSTFLSSPYPFRGRGISLDFPPSKGQASAVPDFVLRKSGTGFLSELCQVSGQDNKIGVAFAPPGYCGIFTTHWKGVVKQFDEESYWGRSWVEV